MADRTKYQRQIIRSYSIPDSVGFHNLEVEYLVGIKFNCLVP
jgi:hypothetical protein